MAISKQGIESASIGSKYRDYLVAAARDNWVSAPSKIAPSTVKNAECPPAAQQAQRGKHRVDSYEMAPQTRKLPPSSLDVQQRIANAGEVVPIVFGKVEFLLGGLITRGGVWIAPSLIRSYCEPRFDNGNVSPESFTEGLGRFANIFIYALSQGQIVSTPTANNVFIGQQSIQSLPGVGDIEIKKGYASAESIELNRESCPLPIEGASCDNDFISWFAGFLTSSDLEIRARGINVVSFGFNILVRATGPLSNTAIEYDIKLIDAQTGEQLNDEIITGLFFPEDDRDLRSSPTAAFWTNFTEGGKSGSYIIRTKLNFIDYQWDIDKPADTNTITEIQVAGRQRPSYDPEPEFVDAIGYLDITTLGIDANILQGETIPKQAFVFIEEGIEVRLYSQTATGDNYGSGASNKFVDLAFYLFTQYKSITSTEDALYQSTIDPTDAGLLSQFHYNYFMLCNGVIDVSINIIDYISEAANYFLAAFINVDGKYRFAPLLPLVSNGLINTGTINPKAVFTESSILGGSYSKQYIPPYDRSNLVVSIVYREVSNKVVSQQKNVDVYYGETPIDAPREQYDLTDLCSDVFHAIFFAAYQLAKRKYVTHSIRFETFLLDTKLIPTDIIRITMDRRTTAGDDRTETNHYQITGITFGQDGRVAIDAIEFPLDSNGQSPICADVDGLNFEVIG
jgi:hypothetical protein